MTKLMLCGDCGDVVSPGLDDMKPRWCKCGRHAVWWRDSHRGLISVHDTMFPARAGSPGGRCWIIGLHNGVLLDGGLVGDPNHHVADDGKLYAAGSNYHTRAERVQAMLAETPDSYVFKKAMSLVVRIYPGSSSDSCWEEVVPK